jgi:hypothetical protein
MIDYRFQGRLSYIPGGALNVQMSAWPAAGGNWWEPTTGTFTVVAAYQAKGAASLAASYVNLANPGTYDLVEGSAPTFDASYGWDFNGSSNYLMTTVIPTSAYTLIVRFSENGTGDNYLVGTTIKTAENVYGYRSSGSYHAYFNVVPRWIDSAGPTAGVIAIAGKTAYQDGSSVGGIGGGSETWDNDLYIGCRNVAPFGRDGYTTAKIQAIAIYSTTLDATQIAEISDNMEAL